MTTAPTATLSLDGASLTVELHALFQAWLEKTASQNNAVHIPVTTGLAVPALGKGEVYAGIVCGKGGVPSHHLVLLPHDTEALSWDNANDWAASIGGELPTRLELFMLYTNHKEHFEEAYYWSCEQYAADSSYAWGQVFDNGFQDFFHKGTEFKARAVRRLVISEFNNLGVA